MRFTAANRRRATGCGQGMLRGITEEGIRAVEGFMESPFKVVSTMLGLAPDELQR